MDKYTGQYKQSNRVVFHKFNVEIQLLLESKEMSDFMTVFGRMRRTLKPTIFKLIWYFIRHRQEETPF